MKQTLDLVIYLQRNSKASNKKAILMKMLQIALSDRETIQLATKGYVQDSAPADYQAPTIEAYKDTLANGSSTLELTVVFPSYNKHNQGVIKDVLRSQDFNFQFFLTELN